jgi:hypothetical protein
MAVLHEQEKLHFRSTTPSRTPPTPDIEQPLVWL